MCVRCLGKIPGEFQTINSEPTVNLTNSFQANTGHEKTRDFAVIFSP